MKKISRKILHFDSIVFSEVIYKYLSSIEKGEYLNILELYKESIWTHRWETSNFNSFTVSSFWEKIEGILQINK